MPQLYANVIQKVNSDQIRYEAMDGIDYLVVQSKTMPSGIIMNNIMYSEEEIDATIHTINETPAPLSHPKIDGKYVSASSQRAQNAFNQAGGINKYIKKDGDSHLIEKWFMKNRLETTDQGKKLLAAINKGEPIHSSTGVLINKVESKGENKYGKYDYIANIGVFDHDAVLIGDIGAATPEQGVGLMVNSQEEVDVLFCNLSEGLDMSNSANVFMCKMQEELTKTFGGDYREIYLLDHNADVAIYTAYEDKESKQYSVKYEIIDDIIKLHQPIEVEGEKVYKSVEQGLFANFKQKLTSIFKPTTTIEQDDNPMSKQFIAALNAAGVITEGLNEDQLFEAYNTHMKVLLTANKADEPKSLTAKEIAELINNGVTAGIKAQSDAQALSVKTALVDQVIANNKDYTDADKETLLATPEKVLNSMIPAKRAAHLVDGMQTNQTEALSSTMPE